MTQNNYEAGLYDVYEQVMTEIIERRIAGETYTRGTRLFVLQNMAYGIWIAITDARKLDRIGE